MAKHSVTVNGQTFTRTSDREYTHVLVGEHDYDLERERFMHPKAERRHGMSVEAQRAYYMNEHIRTYIWMRDELAAGRNREWFAKYITDGVLCSFYEYIRIDEEGQHAHWLADIAKRQERGWGAYGVLSWHQGRANAEKAVVTARNRGWKNLSVVPVESHK